MTKLKEFSTELPKALTPPHAETGVFVYDDAWHVFVKGVFTVKEDELGKRRWNKAVWVGADLHDPATPGKVVYLLDIQVGRGRRQRYAVSHGEPWCDVHGELYRTRLKRGWAREKGPWKLVDAPQARLLNQSAKAAIQMAIEYFNSKEMKK